MASSTGLLALFTTPFYKKIERAWHHLFTPHVALSTLEGTASFSKRKKITIQVQTTWHTQSKLPIVIRLNKKSKLKIQTFGFKTTKRWRAMTDQNEEVPCIPRILARSSTNTSSKQKQSNRSKSCSPRGDDLKRNPRLNLPENVYISSGRVILQCRLDFVVALRGTRE